MRRDKPTRTRILGDSTLSITPMIDVVFLLLIFFMVGMKFREQDRQLETPLRQEGPVARPTGLDPEIWIFIKNQGTAAKPEPRVIIDQVAVQDWRQAHDRLGRLAQAGWTDSTVVLAPDDDALHDWVMKVLDDLKQLGYRTICFKR